MHLSDARDCEGRRECTLSCRCFKYLTCSIEFSFGAQMDPSGKSKGPPPAVKKVLSLFGSGREEDRMVGYLSFLKIGPKLLKFLPGQLFNAIHMAQCLTRGICNVT